MPEDAELLALARAAIAQLNAKYHDPEGPGPVGVPMLDGEPDLEAPVEPFLLLHRPRVWSEGERAWIGVERKRGKLADLNAFLRGGARDKFSLVVGDTCGLQNIRYVITLDTDTQLPRDSARQFIATMAHPLNQPQLDAAGRRVIEGYGILQPRVTASLPSENASRYEHLCGGEPGIDPYTRTVSDVYQDVFYEGSFIGKGIYDVDTFERLLGNRLPDNQILSHDLLEGCYLRAGLLSDAQLYETYPARYSDDVSRRHRWIRGDWQLAGWLLPRVPAANGKREANPLSALSRWKLFDNLRRSVVAPVLTALLLMCWALLPSPWFWSAAVLSVIFLPTFVSALVGLIEKPHDMLLAPAHGGRLQQRQGHVRPRRAADRFPAVRSLVQPRRHRAHRLAHAGHAPQPARMAPVQPGPLVDRHGNQLAAHVVLAGAGGRRRGDAVVRQSGRAVRRRAGAAAVVHGAGHRLVDQPADRARRRRTELAAERCSCTPWRARPGASSRTSSAPRTTGCRPITCRSIRPGWSRTAPRRPTWACRCWPT